MNIVKSRQISTPKIHEPINQAEELPPLPIETKKVDEKEQKMKMTGFYCIGDLPF